MKLADERIQGPFLRYDNDRSEKAIGMPPEEQQSPAFSRPEPPSSLGGYTTSQVSLPRYQFEISEQPTLGTSKALPSAKESVASVIEKIAEAVEDMNQDQYAPQPQYIVLPAQEKPSGSFVPPLVGAAVGAPLGWHIGEGIGLDKYPGYRTLDKAMGWLGEQSSRLPNEPLIRDAADVGGGYLWGKYQGLKMMGPIGAYRLGGAALGLGGGLLAGALLNGAFSNKQAGLSQLVAGAEHATPAWHDALEILGLGGLAVPSIAGVAGHPLDEKTQDAFELAGLGVLAVPSAHSLVGRLRH